MATRVGESTMKQIFFITFITFFYTLHSARQMEDFLQANQYFQKQQFEQAIETYQKIPTKGPVIWYNMAQCYFQLDQFLNALIATKKAQINADPTLLAATYQTINALQDKITITHDSTLVKLARWCSAYCSLLWLQIVVLFFWFLYALSWHISVLQTFSIRFLLLLVLTISGTILSLVWWLPSQKQAITVQETPVYIGPDTQFNTRGILKTAQEVTIKTSLKTDSTHWYKIKTDQEIGWVPADTLEKIETTL